MSKRETQADKILNAIEFTSRWPVDSIHGWCYLPTILRLGIASHTRRISDLRKRGHNIICEKKTVDGVVHSKYRLVKP